MMTTMSEPMKRPTLVAIFIKDFPWDSISGPTVIKKGSEYVANINKEGCLVMYSWVAMNVHLYIPSEYFELYDRVRTVTYEYTLVQKK